jgi:hypothetical protein
VQWQAFERCYFRQTAPIPLFTAEARGEKSLQQFPRIGEADDLTPETDQVQIIILDPLMRGERLMYQAGTDSWNLVGSNTGPNTAAADGDTTVHFPGRNRPSLRNDKIRVVVVGL